MFTVLFFTTFCLISCSNCVMVVTWPVFVILDVAKRCDRMGSNQRKVKKLNNKIKNVLNFCGRQNVRFLFFSFSFSLVRCTTFPLRISGVYFTFNCRWFCFFFSAEFTSLLIQFENMIRTFCTNFPNDFLRVPAQIRVLDDADAVHERICSVASEWTDPE